jgi:DNA-binding protein H-NS
MTELLNAKAELLAELDALNAVDLTAETAKKVAEKKAELDAELDAFKAETEATALAEHENAVAELNINVKFIERAIARAEAKLAEAVEAEAVETAVVDTPADSLA